jgi:membrane-associated phospholipid phosphatase
MFSYLLMEPKNYQPIFAPMFLLAGSIWKYIDPVDRWLIKHINQDWGNPVFDYVLPFVRETGFWLPLYFFLCIFVAINFGGKGLWWILGFLLTAAVADIISSHLIKEMVMRTRPCQDPIVGPQLRFFINYCPGSSSFTSSHATSHFAQGMFFYMTLRTVFKWAWIFLVWAFVICYTQVYVGVHYPFDVLCGGIVGCGIGFIISKLHLKQAGLLSLDK